MSFWPKFAECFRNCCVTLALNVFTIFAILAAALVAGMTVTFVSAVARSFVTGWLR